jgi:alkanesulfonate monooxygenase SsuD/methylene tetrahydromethanopterin reductase-like flavin-dependent oxidoreductase (luciferase family)
LAALRGYRTQFKPSEYLSKPYAILTVAAICAETTEEAERLASSVALAIVRLRNGQAMPFPSPEEALAYPYTAAERAQARAYRNSTQIVGDPATVRSQIDRLVESVGADEVMVASMLHSHAARVRSYELLAEVYGLEPAKP